MNKDYEELAVIADRLAESVLMDWDKEEQARLAKDVATMCHKFFKEENRDFFSSVRKMREAQRNYYNHRHTVGYKVAYKDMINKEYLVDEYLKKMEV